MARPAMRMMKPTIYSPKDIFASLRKRRIREAHVRQRTHGRTV